MISVFGINQFCYKLFCVTPSLIKAEMISDLLIARFSRLRIEVCVSLRCTDFFKW